MSARPPGSPRRVSMRRGQQSQDRNIWWDQKTVRCNLVTAWTSLAEAAAGYKGDCVHFNSVLDHTAFRIHDTDDIFEGLPLHRVQSKAVDRFPNTLWGIVCESHPVVGGAMINRLFTERLGREFDLFERHLDAIVFSMEEHSSNPAFFEIVCRCQLLRKDFGEKPDFLVQVNQALTGLYDVLVQIPQAKLDTDRHNVGKTSGVYGMRESDAYFSAADLLRSILEVLLSPECQSWRTAGGCTEELQDTCLLVCQLGDLLKAHPQVLRIALVFLSNAMAPAFQAGASEKLATFIHTFAISYWSDFIHLIVSCCAANRMDDDDDLRALRQKLFEGRPVEDMHGSRTWLTDVRVMLCHAVAVPYHLLLLLHVAPSQTLSAAHTVPAKFVAKCFTELRERILPVFRQQMAAPLAGRWPPVRVAFATLVAAGDKSPMPLEVVHWLRDELFNWRNFILDKFLPASGCAKDRSQDHLFNFDGFAEMDYSFGRYVRGALQPAPKTGASLPQINASSPRGKPSVPPMSDSVLGGNRMGPYSVNQQLRSEVQKRIDAASTVKPPIGKEWIPWGDGRVVDALGGTSKSQVLGKTLWDGMGPQNSIGYQRQSQTKFGFFHKSSQQTYVG
eukprot:gnl/MRDRNA2_/MRDRNA2_27968_c0_seq1.p1 gnl/MRDRNA2_/MRDRNA2_27968_c0~~gnl/MRDRNA2_/MRDRNA2_27968_c0_seq1.p1  ORF type:complete len:616 (-),score=105.32 gnl/MRDRNA2_/MRDRNA2_27968_c0_seq1:175-2022(-)